MDLLLSGLLGKSTDLNILKQTNKVLICPRIYDDHNQMRFGRTTPLLFKLAAFWFDCTVNSLTA